MLLDLSNIHEAVERVERAYPAAAFDIPPDDFRVAGTVELVVEVHKDDEQYRLVGSVRTMLRLSCGRCLEEYLFPMEASFDLLYLPRGSNVGDGEIEIEEDDLTTAFYADGMIDLGQLLREQFYLALPMKPLCTAACRGLCPECGTNLNHESCACRAESVDPRLAPLKALLKDRQT